MDGGTAKPWVSHGNGWKFRHKAGFSVPGTFGMSPTWILVSWKGDQPPAVELTLSHLCLQSLWKYRINTPFSPTCVYKIYRNIGFYQSLWVRKITSSSSSLWDWHILEKFVGNSKMVQKLSESQRQWDLKGLCLVWKPKKNHLRGINIIITTAQRMLTT